MAERSGVTQGCGYKLTKTVKFMYPIPARKRTQGSPTGGDRVSRAEGSRNKAQLRGTIEYKERDGYF